MSRDEYIDILFVDLKFTAQGKRVWLEQEYGVKYVDELTELQKAVCIPRLKKMKESAKIQKDLF